MATLKDIAEKCSVSIATVSRILNYDENISVSPSTRKKIFEVAEELEYKSLKKSDNLHKHKLSSQKIAIISSYSEFEEIHDVYYLSVRVNLENALNKDNITYELFRGVDDIVNINLADFNGVICVGFFTKKDHAFLKKFNIPIVAVDYYVSDFSCSSVYFDIKFAVSEIIDHLESLNHREMGFIGGIDYDKDSKEILIDSRLMYFEKYLKDTNIYREEYFLKGEYSAKGGYEMAKALLTLKKPPTAIFIANDNMAIGCYKACDELGVKIPSDISIVSFNDIPNSKFMTPSLTTVKLSTNYLVETALATLLEEIENPNAQYKKIALPSKLVVRNSTAEAKK